MLKKVKGLAIIGLLISQTVSASVPPEAFNFDTNIDYINMSDSQESKFNEAAAIIKRVIKTEEFRSAVINHTYNGIKTFVDNDGKTNAEIYQELIDGAETLNRIKNNVMDMEVELYYEDTNTVGYTSSRSPRIFVNTKYFNTYSANSVARNLMHEWTHKLGFSHASSYSTSRDYSVPYAVGKIIGELALDGVGLLSAPTGLSLIKDAANITLNWNAASSPVGIKEYRIYRRLKGSTTNYLQAATTDLTYTQTLPAESAYYYVRSVDHDEETAKSSEIYYDSFFLTAPGSLQLSKTTSTVTLTWNQAASSVGGVTYKIYRRLSGSSTIYLQGTTSSLSFSQAAPSKDATYYVRSYDKNGNTAKSSEVSYDSYYLTAPSNLAISKTSSKVTLSWGKALSSEGVASYKIYRRLSGSTINYLQGSTTYSSFTQTKPSGNAVYYVRVYDRDGFNIKSEEISYSN